MKPEDEDGRTLSVSNAFWQMVSPQKTVMLLCDKGVRADKHACVKCFKDEFNSDVKTERKQKK